MASIRRRNGKYQAQVRRAGCQPISKTFRDRRVALEWARKVESELERGLFVACAAAERWTVAQAIDRFLAEVLPTYRSADSAYKWASKLKPLRAELGRLTLAQLRTSHLANYRGTRRLSVGPQTIKHELGLLGRILKTAQADWGLTLPRGVPAVAMPKLPRGRDRRLQAGEEDALLRELAGTVLRAAVILAIETGMRRGEIANIERRHVDFRARTLHIPETKTDIPRTIPLTRRAVETLLALPFPHAGNMSHAFARACKRAGIEDLRFHDLRHEATSRLFELGLNPMEVAAITGHQDLRMLKRYTHLRAGSLLAKLDAPSGCRRGRGCGLPTARRI